MSGHSKWATIKRTKGKLDAQRGAEFSRLAKDIMVAARHGGGNPDGNVQLRTAIAKARAGNMPNDNIQRAILKATGQLEGQRVETMVYEGYGPAGVAVMMDISTDNRNRTAGEIRHFFSKYGGNLGETGSVGWMFSRKGLITIDRSATAIGEDDLMLLVLDAGAEDVRTEEETFEVITGPDELDGVLMALEQQGIPVEQGKVELIPSTTVEVRGDDARKVMKLLELLEEHDDVENVYSNAEIPADELDALG